MSNNTYFQAPESQKVKKQNPLSGLNKIPNKTKNRVILGTVIGLVSIMVIVIIIIFVQIYNTQSSQWQNSKMVLVDKQKLGTNQVAFGQKGEIVTFGQNKKIRISDKEMPNSPEFVPVSVYNTQILMQGNIPKPSSDKDMLSTTIINESQKTTILQGNNFLKLSDTISQVTPFGNRFLFLESKDKEIYLYNSSDIYGTSDLAFLGKFTVDNNISKLELKIINNQPYVFVYKNKDLEIRAAYKGSIDVIKTLNNVTNVKAGPKEILIKNGNQLEIINFNLENGGNTEVKTMTNGVQYLELQATILEEKKLSNLNQKLEANNLSTDINPEKCIFDSNSLLYCIATNKNRDSEIVKYYPSNDQLELLNLGKFGSLQKFYISSNDTYFAVTSDNYLYQIQK